MSLSAEYGLAIGLMSQGRGEAETESWNGNGVDTRVSETGKNSSFGIDNDISGGAISLNFYF